MRSTGTRRTLQMRATPTSSASRASGTYALDVRTGRGSSLDEKRGRSAPIDARVRSSCWCDARRSGVGSSAVRESRGSIDSRRGRPSAAGGGVAGGGL